MTPGARRRQTGIAGELKAARWYESHGYRVVARNWRCRLGELDLVVQRGDLLVFVEVKSRSGTGFGAPAEAVGPAKQRRVRALAVQFLQERGWRAAEIRFDVAAVLGARVEVVEHAF